MAVHSTTTGAASPAPCRSRQRRRFRVLAPTVHLPLSGDSLHLERAAQAINRAADTAIRVQVRCRPLAPHRSARRVDIRTVRRLAQEALDLAAAADMAIHVL